MVRYLHKTILNLQLTLAGMHNQIPVYGHAVPAVFRPRLTQRCRNGQQSGGHRRPGRTHLPQRRSAKPRYRPIGQRRCRHTMYGRLWSIGIDHWPIVACKPCGELVISLECRPCNGQQFQSENARFCNAPRNEPRNKSLASGLNESEECGEKSQRVALDTMQERKTRHNPRITRKSGHSPCRCSRTPGELRLESKKDIQRCPE